MQFKQSIFMALVVALVGQAHFATAGDNISTDINSVGGAPSVEQQLKVIAADTTKDGNVFVIQKVKEIRDRVYAAGSAADEIWSLASAISLILTDGNVALISSAEEATGAIDELNNINNKVEEQKGIANTALEEADKFWKEVELCATNGTSYNPAPNDVSMKKARIEKVNIATAKRNFTTQTVFWSSECATILKKLEKRLSSFPKPRRSSTDG